MNKKWTSATVAGFFVLSMSANALANEENAADILHQSNEAMLELDSFSSETMMELIMPDPMSGEEVTLSVNTKEDVTLDPFAMHQVSTMSTPEGDIETTFYWTEDGMYEQGPDGEWFLYEGMSSEEMMSLLQTSTSHEQAEMMGEDMSVSDEGDSYILTYEGTGEDLNEMINELLGEMMEEDMQGADEMLEAFEISNLDYEMTIEKETHYMTEMSMHMTMMIDDGEESVEMDISMEQMVSNFNGVDPITVPDEVKENAEPIDAGGGAMPDTASNNLLYAAGGLALAVSAFGLSLFHRRRVRV
ncbi:DUF6612 family protein [Shouchella patagoniensis]|uniref:DUF6612 family protein n=1 Tax=Shouchella patagoniensis TaxID=228576 RepID=UPI000995135C|nr:DUF6612 family protein [Shouchella patagoniensis]